jgi:hypothetical protein
MRKVICIFIICFSVFFLFACQNSTQKPNSLNVEQVSKSNINKWVVAVKPRLVKDKWVYDTEIEYLGNSTVTLTVVYYDKTKVTYEELQPFNPIKTKGSPDYKESVYSEENSSLKFELQWKENGNIKYGETIFNVMPK